MSKFSKGLLGATLLGFGLQVWVVAASEQRSETRLASSILCICLAILATASCADAGRQANPYARHFWRLTAVGFFLLTCAFAISS